MFDLKEAFSISNFPEHDCLALAHRSPRLNTMIDGADYAFVLVVETERMLDRYSIHYNATPSNRRALKELLGLVKTK